MDQLSAISLKPNWKHKTMQKKTKIKKNFTIESSQEKSVADE